MTCQICGNEKALMRFADGTCSKCRGSVNVTHPVQKLCRITFVQERGRQVVFSSLSEAARALKVNTKTVTNWARGFPSRNNKYRAELVGSL